MSQFAYLEFKDVLLQKIVDIDWENWDRKDKPQFFPPGGEPENYILKLPHSPSAAARTGRLFEAIVSIGAEARIVHGEVGTRSKIILKYASWNGCDLFTVRIYDYEHIVATEAAKSWFESMVGDWVSFEPMQCE